MKDNFIKTPEIGAASPTQQLNFCIEGEEIMSITRDGTITIKDDGKPLNHKAQKFFELLHQLFKEAGGIR